MTEDEAKQRWCPFARDMTGQDNGVSMAMATFNRPFTPDHLATVSCACIGSACMAWRWDNTWESATEEGQGGTVVLRLKRLSGEPKIGYCGLARRPE